MRIPCLVLVFAAINTSFLTGQEDRAQPVALVGGMLIDGFERPPIHHAAIVIRGERIVDVGPINQVTIPENARVIDTSGKTMLPGLIDLHVHVDILGHGDYDEWYAFAFGNDRMHDVFKTAARQLLAAGVTTALDLGAPLDVVTVRDSINAGHILGPRLFTSGPWVTRIMLDGVPSALQNVVRSPEEAAQVTNELLDAGVDVIKTWSGLTAGDYDAIVSTAHERETRVHSHLYRPDAIRLALNAGVDVLHHVGSGGNPPYDADLVAEIAHRGVPVVQTISHRIWVYAATLEFPERLYDPDHGQHVPRDIYREMLRSFEDFERLSYFSTTPRQIRNAPKAARQFIDGGARMAMGTDSGTPLNFHTESAWREISALVEMGMSEMEAISAATKTGAEVLGIAEETGTIQPGLLADIIVVDGNPLANINVLRRVELVVRGGYVVDGGQRPGNGM